MRILALFILVAGLVAPVEASSRSDVEVEWNGVWYDAVIVARDGDQRLVHYVGYDASWDEWVGPDRLREAAASIAIARGQWRAGDAVSVEWGGSWWPATIVATRDDLALIHYEGYDASWDEWVDDSRIR